MTDEIIYEILTEADWEEAAELALQIMFTREPVTVALGVPLPPPGHNPFSKLKPIGLGLSTVAKDSTTGKVVGVRFTADWVDTPGPPDLPPVAKAYYDMWKKHTDDFAAAKGGITEKGEWAHWVGITVHSDYSKRGISTRLYKENCELLKSKGFKGAVVENVSAFSGRAADKVGAITFSKTEYTSYELEDGSKPFAGVKAPHTHFQLKVLEF